MTTIKWATIVCSSLIALNPWAYAHAHAQSASASLTSPTGDARGTVTLEETSTGVLITATVRDLNAGKHAFHIHETGKCAPDMKAAGGHFAPNKNKHGFKTDGGPHAGDMLNFQVPADVKELTFEIFNSRVTLKDGEVTSLLDDDGAAIVIHAGADDYTSQPSGNAGNRVACGVITAK